jgi:hypothetical protein
MQPYTLSLIAIALVACSSSHAPADASADALVDAAQQKDAAPDVAACAPPQGTTCPTTAGNCKGIGAPCTKGGNECPSPTACDVDLDPSGAGICITILACTPGNHDCGNGASCCKTPMTSNTAVCLPNPCIPSDCTAE